MALTKTWRQISDLGTIVSSIGQYSYRQQIDVGPTVEGSTLLRTICSLEIKVSVPAGGSMPPADWWSTSYAEMRVVWSADGSVPLLTQDVRDPGDLGRSMLRPTIFGRSDVTDFYVVRFDQISPIDTPAMRDAPAGNLPKVWLFTYYGDRDHGLNGSYDTEICISAQLDTLWGA